MGLMHKLRERYVKASEALIYFKRIMKILASGGKIYLFVIVLFAVSFGVIPSVSILVMQEIVNALQSDNQNFEHVLMFATLYIGIDIFSKIAGLVTGYIESTLQMKAGITLNMSVLEKVRELTLKDFENSETYNLIQRAVGTSISTLFSFFKSFVLVFQSLITLVMFSVILLSWRWWILPIIFIIPLVNTFVTAYLGKKHFLIQKNRVGKGRKQWYFQYLLTNDIAFKEIKIFNLSDYFRSKYKQLSLEFLKEDLGILWQRGNIQLILLIVEQIIYAILFIYIILQAFMGGILLGHLITYTRSISNIKSGAQGFLSKINSIYQDILTISQYFDFVDMKTEVEAFNEKQPLTTIPHIEIRNLSYKYENKSNYALQNLNITIEGNSLVAFIGINGSGKTTLVKILSTLYNDYYGDVFFGGKNLREINVEDVRSKIGILFQDFVKYELTARENVALGQLEKINNDCEIIQALSRTNMQEKVINLESQLGFWFENGVQLSGGEWLRVALSRAFIRDADFYLLDEPNSALDPVSERQILKSFKELAKGKIGIIVSHRIASIKNIVDKIVVFDNGLIQTCGTHDELLKTSKVYRELYEQENGMLYEDTLYLER